MTTTTDTPPLVRALPATVALAATGPLAVAVLRGVLPHSTVDDPTTIAAAVAAAPGAQAAVLGLTYLALLTLPLGVLIVGRAAAAARPVLGRVAAVVSWLGFTSLFFVAASDQVALAGAAVGQPPASVGALVAATEAHPVSAVAAVVFVVGHIVGTVLLGVALWRVLPRAVAVGLIASQPLHLVFAVVVPVPLLDVLAWVLTAVGFAVAAHAGGRVR